MTRTLTLLIILCSLASGHVLAQRRDTCVITTLDGLADDNINSICKDHRGLVWFATDHGLSCYNGVTITNVTTPDGSISRMSDIAEDSQGRMVAASPSGLYALDMPTFTLRRICPQCTEAHSLCTDRRGILYACSDKGLYTVQNDDNATLTTFDDNVMSADNATVDMCADPRHANRIWVCGAHTLHRINTATGKKHTYNLARMMGGNLEITSIDIYGDCLYIGTKSMGVLQFSTSTERVSHYSVLPKENVHDLSIDSKGHLHVSMYMFYEVDLDTDRVVHKRQSSSAYTTYTDTSLGVTWYGHFLEGITYSYHTRNLANTFACPGFDPSRVFTRSFHKHGDDVVIGTREGFYHINKQQGLCLFFAPQDINARIITDVVWFGGKFILTTIENGIRIYSPDTHTVSQPADFVSSGGSAMHFTEGDFSSLAITPDGSTLAAASNRGLFFFDQQMKCVRHFSSRNSHLTDRYITSLFYDAQGKLWMGTEAGLFIMLAKDNDIIDTFPETFFHRTPYLAFSQDTDGDVLAFGNGKVFKCKSDLSSYVTYDLAASSGCTNINFVHPFGNSSYLAGTSAGLFLFDRHFLHYTHYSLSDHLPSLIFNKFELQILPDSSLWLATCRGVICLSRQQQKQLSQPVKGRVVLDKLWIDNAVTPPGQLMQMIDNPDITVSWNMVSQDIAFIPLMLDYSLCAGRLYEHILDTDSISTCHDRQTVNISHLSLGTHTLTIRLAGHPETATTYRITVLPSVLFYFQLLFLVLLIIVIFISIHLHDRRMRYKQKLRIKHSLEQEISAQRAVATLQRQQQEEQ